MAFGGTPVCAHSERGDKSFEANIKTPSNLTKGQSYPIVVTVIVGTTQVATATVTVIANKHDKT